MATKISELPTTQKVGSILDETLNVGGAAATATTATVTIPRTTATTNTVEPLLALNRQSSAPPANGIGGSLVFDVETAAGNTERGACIEAVTTDVTSTSEDFDLVFKTMKSGAAATEEFRLRSTTSDVFIKNGLIASGSVIGSLKFNTQDITNRVSHFFDYNGYSHVVSGGQFGWTNNATTATGVADAGLARNAAGVVRVTDGSTQIRGLLGGGAAVASATALPLPTGRVFHVTGTTGITSITSTNFAAGCVITLIFDDILTVSDGNNLVLAGALVTAANTTLTLAYDGTSWFETSRSTN